VGRCRGVIGQVVSTSLRRRVGYDAGASAVFVMVVCFWRTDTTCYGSLNFNSGGARKPILVACGEIVVGSANHPRGTQSISGFPKGDHTAQVEAFFCADEIFFAVSSLRLHLAAKP
jgi:hypothetical protein